MGPLDDYEAKTATPTESMDALLLLRGVHPLEFRLPGRLDHHPEMNELRPLSFPSELFKVAKAVPAA